MRILIAADHAGFSLKEALKPWLATLGHEIDDLGAYSLADGDDYPDFMHPVAQMISENPETMRGIIIGGSGQGEAMVANRYPNVRAVVYYDPNLEIITLSREHNNANILSLGARFLSLENAKEAIKIWLDTPFSNEERHKRRLIKIEE